MGLLQQLGRHLPLPWLSAAPDPAPRIKTLQEYAGASNEGSHIVLGYHLLETEELKPLIDEIQNALGAPEDVFRLEFMPLLQRSAEFLQMTPASRLCHHYQPGGALVHGLETCQEILKLTSGTRFDRFMPRNPVIPPPEKDQFKRYSRMVLALIGMVHDIGKISTDFEFSVYDENGSLITPRQPYDPHANGGPYTQTLYQYTREHLQRDPATCRYYSRFKTEREVNGHDSEWQSAVESILTAIRFHVPPEARAAYLNTSADTFRYVIALKRRADHQSVEKFLRKPRTKEVLVGPYELHRVDVACLGVLHYLASRGLLADLPIHQGSPFISKQHLSQLLQDMPDLDDFGTLPRNPHVPEALMKTFIHRGIAVRPDDLPRDASRELTMLNEQPGMLLHFTYRGFIEKYQAIGVAAAVVDEEEESEMIAAQQSPGYDGEDRGPSADEPPPDAPPPHTEVPSDYEDISGFGEDVPLADSPAPSGQARQPTSDATGPGLAPLTPQYPPAIVAVAKVVQGVDDELIAKLGLYIIDGMLFVPLSVVMDIVRPHDIVGAREFKELSDKFVSDRWVVQVDAKQKGLLLTQHYTKACMDPGSVDMLLIDTTHPDAGDPIAAVDESAATPEAPTKPATPKNQPRPAETKPPKTNGQAQRQTPVKETSSNQQQHATRELSIDAFCQFLAEEGRAGNTGELAIGNDGRLRIPMALVDAYIEEPRRRGMFGNALKKQGAFAGRSKRYFYLDTTNEVVKRWLNELPILK